MFGLILAGLMRRRDDGIAPFTVMSLRQHSRQRPRHRRTPSSALPQLIDPSICRLGQRPMSPSRTAWSTASRRRPPTASATCSSDDFGIEDNWPVFCETFKQWVLEDNFPAGRPALEKVGVQFVADVAPFELMKIRILNGGHATIAYPAGADGHPFRP